MIIKPVVAGFRTVTSDNQWSQKLSQRSFSARTEVAGNLVWIMIRTGQNRQVWTQGHLVDPDPREVTRGQRGCSTLRRSGRKFVVMIMAR